MSLTFLTPNAAFVTFIVLFPLAVLAILLRRASVRDARFGVRQRVFRARLLDVFAVVTVCGLLGIAAAGPVFISAQTKERTNDREVILLFDVSRSMDASFSSSDMSRLERAKTIAKTIRASFPDMAIGVGTFTDRALPAIFPPSTDEDFLGALRDVVRINNLPPSAQCAECTSTLLPVIVNVLEDGYFSDAASRTLIVFTDGETDPGRMKYGAFTNAEKNFGTQIVFVHVWDASERIFRKDGTTESYRPDLGAPGVLDAIAQESGADVVSESDYEQLFDALQGTTGMRFLGPWFVLAAIAPLGLLFFRRNM